MPRRKPRKKRQAHGAEPGPRIRYTHVCTGFDFGIRRRSMRIVSFIAFGTCLNLILSTNQHDKVKTRFSHAEETVPRRGRFRGYGETWPLPLGLLHTPGSTRAHQRHARHQYALARAWARECATRTPGFPCWMEQMNVMFCSRPRCNICLPDKGMNMRSPVRPR